MFTFHRPKIYRSSNGCCICRAKSSSSRFTDSQKYENEFNKCFNLSEGQQRSGEICNACVLLIKRWKKLPKGTERNWNHVVDARAGPGGKSLLRSRQKLINKAPSMSHREARNQKKQRRHKIAMERIRKMRLMDRLSRRRRNSQDGDFNSDRTPSPTPSECSSSDQESVKDGSVESPRRSSTARFNFPPSLRAILDLSYWIPEQTCCGTIFKGQRGEVLVDPKLMKPCWCSSNTTPQNPYANPIPPPTSTTERAHKRDTRQDSLGSEGSLEISEADDLEDSAVEEDDSVKRVMQTIMEGVEGSHGNGQVMGQERSEVTAQ
ncbi:SIN3-HDAC complex-associated factor-like [Amphiura filiformis]|uniref:SIN3-HDAC complex-associated factor-like n=1 Tax=Amphiura filiformis TaxID=82378 RepID=UPI003B2118F5